MKLYQDRSSGFTLVEALAATAILIILLGLSAVGVARWRDPLKITELDNAARAIYMAAENRAVLLQNSGASFSLLADSPGEGITASEVSVTQDGTEQTVSLCVLSDAARADILDELLPAGVIDPSLRDGHFYILYDKNTCHVFEVFYAEEKFDKTELNDLRGRNRSQRVSYYRGDTANRCLVGYYEGGLAGQIGTKPLPTPGVEVLIENGSELRLTVRYTIPAQLTGADVKRVPTVTLEYKGEKVKLLFVNDVTKNVVSPYSERLTKDQDITSNTKPMSAEYIWTLDSLEQDGGGNFTKRFKDLFNNPDSIAFGGDFTVTASLRLSADGYLSSSSSAQATDNSLFDTTSTGDTAKVANLRHLQNLDSDSSGAAGKKTAVQCADIDCSKYIGNNGNELVSNYEFKPIQNNDLTAYDARHDEAGAAALPYSISNLTVTANSADKKNGAGLFGSVGSEFIFQSVRLVNSNVTTESTSSGALLGYFWSPVKFDSCQVIGAKISTSGVAGGMAGFNWDESNSGHVIFINCTIEKLEVNSSSGYAGGLLGGKNIDETKATGNATVSFTDCTANEIQVTGLNYTGGLTGAVDSTTSFTNCQVVNAAVKITGWKVSTGGIAGYNATTDISFQNCKVEALTVSSLNESYAGGMLGGKGSKGTATFINCEIGTDGQSIAIFGHHAGGILGNADEGSTAQFSACTVGMKTGNTVKITGVNYAGGLVGNSGGGSLDDSKISNADITATGDFSEAGGLAGRTTNSDFMRCTATGVTVNAGNSAGGLAGNVTGGAFSDCKSINAKAASTAWSSEAGGLVGRMNGTNLTKCWVYWENTAGMTALDFKVTAVTVGGLVGSIKSGGTITESFAATLVKGTTYAGGLVGNLDMPAENQLNNPTKITKSYADCYIWSGSWAGGLIGVQQYLISKKGEVTEEVYDYLKLTLQEVYATGKISGAESAAGLCGGWATIRSGKETEKTENVYVAMQYSGVAYIHSLAAHWDALTGASNYHFLNYNENTSGKTYNQMSDQTFANTMGTAFQKPASSTVPYNLDGGSRATYPFPGLVGLPHYGDWPIS